MTPAAMPAQHSLLWLLLAVTLIWFSNLEYRKLVRPEEGRYAEIPREMAVSGDWLTPRLNGIKYFEKPPLQYWATAAAYTVFGEHHWTARLWPALTGWLGVLLIFYAGRRLFGDAAGFYSALVLASSPLYVLVAHVNTLDMGVTFFMTAALLAFLLAQHAAATPRENRTWMHLAWAAAALAVLSKGLIGVVLPAAALVVYSVVQRDFALWKRLHLATGMALFLLIAAPWFVAVSIANPEFPRFFFIHEHFERFLTAVHKRDQPWWYFVPILAAGALPWLVTMGDAAARAWRADDEPQAFQPRRFLLVWAGVIFVFFSVSSSKLPSYIVPIFPALALLAGNRLVVLKAKAALLGHGRTLAWQLAPAGVIALVALAAAPYAVLLASDEVPAALYQGYVPWLIAAAAVALAGIGYAIYAAWRARITAAVAAAGLASLLAAQLGLTGHEALSPASSAYHLVKQIEAHLKPGVPFYSVGTYEQTLPFYIKRPVTLVAFRDELSFGLEQEPRLWVPDHVAFERAWRGHRYALALMTPQTYAQFAGAGLPMQLIARDTRRVVVKTPGASG